MRRRIIIEYPPISPREGFRPLAADATEFAAGQAHDAIVEKAVELIAGHGAAELVGVFHSLHDAQEAAELLQRHFPRARIKIQIIQAEAGDLDREDER